MIGPTFHIDTEDLGGVPVVTVSGEIDIKTAPRVESALAELPTGPVFVDLCAVDFIDSTGLRTLVMARNRIQQDGGSFTVCAGEDGIVVRTMRLAGLAADFEIVPSREELTKAP